MILPPLVFPVLSITNVRIGVVMFNAVLLSVVASFILTIIWISGILLKYQVFFHQSFVKSTEWSALIQSFSLIDSINLKAES